MTSPGRYSAGTAFLDVIPSFRGVQNAIGRQVRDMEKALGKDAGEKFGKEFEASAVKAVDRALGTSKARESGKKSGEEFGSGFEKSLHDSMARAQSQLRGIKIDAEFDDTTARRQFRSLQHQLERLGKVKIGVDMDAGPAFIIAQRLEEKLRQLQDASPNIGARTDFGRALASLAAFRKEVEKTGNLKAEVQVEVKTDVGKFEATVKRQIAAALESLPPARIDADASEADHKIAELRKRLFELNDKRIGVNISGSQAMTEVEAIRVALAELAQNRTIDIRARADTASAAKDLLELRKLETLIDGTKVEIKADVDTTQATSKLMRLRQMAEGSSDNETGANAFRAFNFAVLGIAAALPIVVPLLTAAAGGIALMGAMALGAAAGLGVMVLAFSGIGTAVKALGDVQQNSAKDAEAASKRMRTASRSVEDAQRGVSRATEGQEAAERSLVRAQADVVRAQEAVTRAREEARERIEDLALSVEGGALAEERATMRLTEAREEYESSLSDPEATAKDRADLLLSYKEQDLALRVIKERNGDLAAEQAEANRTGVEGSREVVDAQSQVADAQAGVQDALRGISDAARGVEDAQRNLAQAQEDYNTALYETGTMGSTSVQALEAAMAKLSPAGQDFALFLHGMRDEFRELRDIAQAGILPGVQEAISDIMGKNGPLLREFIGSMSTAIGDLFRDLGELFTSKQWQGIFAVFTEYAPIFMTQFGQIGMALLTFFGELFRGIAPYAESFGETLVNLATASAEWMAAFVQGETFRAIMEWLFTNGPIIFDTIWDIIVAIGNLFVALEPLGMVILGLIDNIAEWIAGMDPDTLGTIVTIVLGLVVAFQLASGALALVVGTLGILSSPVTLIIFAVGALVAVLVALYNHSETARKIMDDFGTALVAIFNFIAPVISWWWENIVQPVFIGMLWYFTAAVRGIAWAIENILIPAWNVIATVATWLWENVLQPVFSFIADAWNVLVEGIKWAWDNILHPVWDVLMSVAQVLLAILVVGVFGPIALAWKLLSEGIKWIYENAIKPVFDFFAKAGQETSDKLGPIFQFISDTWDIMAQGMRAIYDNFIYPYIVKPFQSAFETLQGAFEVVVRAISTAWESLQNALAKPVNFVIHYILNKGLFGAFNWIIETLHLPAEWKIADWEQIGDPSTHYAVGGPVAGWSPNDKADNIPAMLTANEFVQPVDATRYYGMDNMELLRKKRIPREVFDYFSRGGAVQHRATGGQIFELTKTAFPNAKLNSAYRPGANDYHGRNMAADMGEAGFAGGSGRAYIAAMKRWWVDNFGSMVEEIIYTGAGNDRPNIKNGRPFNYSAGINSTHLNHLHVAEEGSIFALAGAVGASGGLSGDAALAAGGNPYAMFFENAGAVLTKLKDSIGRIGELADQPIFQFIKEIPGKMVDFAWEKIKDVVGGLFDGNGNIDDPVNQIPVGAVQQIVQSIAATRGWGSGAQWNALAALIAKESSWNPNAQNPTSTAYGLFQFLDGTWAGTGYQKTGDISTQTLAGLKYIADRYGTPAAAWAFHQSHNWYSEGGSVEANVPEAAPTLYDTGGWLPPGVTTVLNATNKPEPILTAQQWDELTSGEGRSSAAPLIGEYNQNMIAADPAEAFEQLQHDLRIVRLQGKYTEVR